MSNDIDSEVIKAYRVHRKSVKIISGFLRELDPHSPQSAIEHNAAAILARLAHANLLVEEVTAESRDS